MAKIKITSPELLDDLKMETSIFDLETLDEKETSELRRIHNVMYNEGAKSDRYLARTAGLALTYIQAELFERMETPATYENDG